MQGYSRLLALSAGQRKSRRCALAWPRELVRAACSKRVRCSRAGHDVEEVGMKLCLVSAEVKRTTPTHATARA